VTHRPIVRALADYTEMKRAVEFQRVIWGADFNEVVPAVMFWAVARTGGIVAGAFDGSGEMIGLLFGMTGWDGSRPVHWSDMLGVHPSARGRGIGLALKRFQRSRLLENNVSLVSWTFDPLEARNAQLNFRRLGVTASEYIRDCYGASTSPLHRDIGTDRLVVRWELDSARVRERMEGAAGPAVDGAGTPVVNPAGGALRLDLADEIVRVRIPADIQTLKARDAVAARRWRTETRAAFEAYLGRGYEVMEVERGSDESCYVLARRAAG
jgi:predicted GNAT superfamily acetyltransferase